MGSRRISRFSRWFFVVGAFGVSGWLLLNSGTSSLPAARAAQSEVDASKVIDLGTYSRVQSLREELALTNRDLASVGATGVQAAQVIEAVRVWEAQNRATLDGSDTEIVVARAQVENVFHQINVGPRSEAANASLQPAILTLESARQRRSQVLDAAAAMVGAGLNGAQRESLSNARANKGIPDKYRYLPLSPDDRSKLTAVSGDIKPSQALEALAASRGAQFAAMREQSMNAIADAEAAALPAPPELSFNPSEVEGETLPKAQSK